MHIKEVVLEGFKSYAQRTVISGWDPRFNAVTGFNGSGKSNILDAICFVLGITNLTQVRASNLQDLVYKRGQAGIQKASVSIIFDNANKDSSPIGYSQFDEIVVTRQVVVGGKNKFIINGHTTQQQVIQNLFQSIQLNVNNPHFLIMQGKITKVLNMKPMEILAMVEEAAGTRMFEERKEKAFKTISKKEKKLLEIQSLLQEEIIPKLNQLRFERTVYLEYQQLNQDIERTERHVILMEFRKATNIKKNGESIRRDQQAILENLDSEIHKVQHLRDELKTREQKLTNSMSSSRFNKLQTTLNEHQKKIAQLETQLLIKNRSKDEESSSLDSINSEHERLVKCLEDAQLRHASSIRDLDRTKNLIEDKTRDVTNLQDRISALSMPGAAKADAKAAAVKQFNEEKTLLESLIVERESLLVRIQVTDQQIARIEPDIAQNLSNMNSLSSELDRANLEVTAFNDQLLKLQGRNPNQNLDLKLTELRDDKQRFHRQVEKLTKERDNVYAKIAHVVGFDYSDPCPNFDRSQVYGTVASLVDIQAEHQNKAVALEMTAGGRLQNVVVSTEDIGSQILNRGRLRKRVTLIPLNKIQPTVVAESKFRRAMDLASNKINLALDLVRYTDTDLKSAMQYVFGNTFVCQDADTANRVTFDQQIKTRSVTWAGDVYEPSGVLSGGSKPQSSGLLMNVMQYRQLEREICECHDQINHVSAQLATVEREAAQIREAMEKLEGLVRRRDHIAERLENGKSEGGLETQLRTAKQTKEDLAARLADLNMREQRTQLKVKELEQEVKAGNAVEGGQLNTLKARLKSARREQSNATEVSSQAKVDVEVIGAEIEELNGELKLISDRILECTHQVKELDLECDAIKKELAENREVHSSTSKELSQLKREQACFDTDRAELVAQLKQVSTQLNQLEAQRNEHQSKSTQLRRDIESASDLVKQLQAKHQWIATAMHTSPSGQDASLDQAHTKLQHLRKRYEQLKRTINVNVMEMIGVAERREVELQEKLATVLRDKNKIEETINKLDQIKEVELSKTWTQVNRDFGEIFSDLLPGGNSTTLSPLQPNKILSGLQIHVRLGKIWKDSLTELSGGQRSLIALSLVLALLQCKPAPMYILDEVDAALDLSHTQNIGQLIKSRFTNSQFIVVSLKDGMFSNANVIFKTRFRDGTSSVERVKGTPVTGRKH